MNPKAETVEELQMRRKVLHMGMCKLLREDLSLLADEMADKNDNTVQSPDAKMFSRARNPQLPMSGIAWFLFDSMGDRRAATP